jgi:sporulation protein YlmC with PRC-barrel domain
MRSNFSLPVMLPLCLVALGQFAVAPAYAQATNTDCRLFTSKDNVGAETTYALKSDLPSTAPAGERDRNKRPSDPDEGILLSDLMRKAVYSSDGIEVGTITDIVMGEDFNGQIAIVDMGGFLGIGGKSVAVPKSDLLIQSTGNDSQRIQISSTQQQLETAPAYERTALMR